MSQSRGAWSFSSAVPHSVKDVRRVCRLPHPPYFARTVRCLLHTLVHMPIYNRRPPLLVPTSQKWRRVIVTESCRFKVALQLALDRLSFLKPGLLRGFCYEERRELLFHREIIVCSRSVYFAVVLLSLKILVISLVGSYFVELVIFSIE